jgi:hypothetical protein
LPQADRLANSGWSLVSVAHVTLNHSLAVFLDRKALCGAGHPKFPSPGETRLVGLSARWLAAERWTAGVGYTSCAVPLSSDCVAASMMRCTW